MIDSKLWELIIPFEEGTLTFTIGKILRAENSVDIDQLPHISYKIATHLLNTYPNINLFKADEKHLQKLVRICLTRLTIHHGVCAEGV